MIVLKNFTADFLEYVKLDPLDFFFNFFNHPYVRLRIQVCSNIKKIIKEKQEYLPLLINNTIYLEKLTFLMHSKPNEVKFIILIKLFIFSFQALQNKAVHIISIAMSLRGGSKAQNAHSNSGT